MYPTLHFLPASVTVGPNLVPLQAAENRVDIPSFNELGNHLTCVVKQALAGKQVLKLMENKLWPRIWDILTL